MTLQGGLVMRRAADRAWVRIPDGEIECTLRRGVARSSGKMAVGDHVTIDGISSGHPHIVEILPRKTYLPRPHLANLDHMVIVTAFQAPPMNLALVDRLSVIGRAIELDITIVFNKTDRMAEEENRIPAYYQKLGWHVILASAINEDGIADLEERLRRKLSVFVGASGVGKTSLLKALDPKIDRPVGALSVGEGHGKHTTARSEIIFLRGNATLAVADTPGFDWVGLLPNRLSAIQTGFPEFEEHARWCAFRNCAHLKETECAVRASAEAGTIWPSRYESYKKFAEELATRPKHWERKKR